MKVQKNYLALFAPENQHAASSEDSQKRKYVQINYSPSQLFSGELYVSIQQPIK